MDKQTARHMTELTRDFYRTVGDSFSATRQAPWPGWERVLAHCISPAQSNLLLLDLACGNLRFERFVAEGCCNLEAWCVDLGPDPASAPLPPATIHYQQVDLAESPQAVEAPLCDLCVSFGFMHHLPLVDQRLSLLNSLVAHTRPQGFVAVTFWQFAHNERLRAKARPVPNGDAGDYLLGWQDRTDVARYCHHFCEAEIDELVSSVSSRAQEVARFSADGRTGDLNRYVLFQRA